MTLAAFEPLKYVWLMPALMALSFVTILFVGKRLPKKGAEVAIACIGLCFVFAVISGVSWIDRVNDAADAPAEEHALVLPAGGSGEGEQAEDAEEHHEVEPVVTEATWFTIGGHDYKA